MSDDAGAGLVERARAAAARGDWQQAFDLLMEADADDLLAPTDLPVLGEVAYAAGHLDVTIEAWERAHAACMQAGDQVAAAGAAVRLAMHLLFDTALMAPVRGWLARAERLLEGRDETPAHAWLAVVRAYERMLTGDMPGARQWARRAIEVGSTCDPAACAIGRVAEARLAHLGRRCPARSGVARRRVNGRVTERVTTTHPAATPGSVIVGPVRTRHALTGVTQTRSNHEPHHDQAPPRRQGSFRPRQPKMSGRRRSTPLGRGAHTPTTATGPSPSDTQWQSRYASPICRRSAATPKPTSTTTTRTQPTTQPEWNKPMHTNGTKLTASVGSLTASTLLLLAAPTGPTRALHRPPMPSVAVTPRSIRWDPGSFLGARRGDALVQDLPANSAPQAVAQPGPRRHSRQPARHDRPARDRLAGHCRIPARPHKRAGSSAPSIRPSRRRSRSPTTAPAAPPTPQGEQSR